MHVKLEIFTENSLRTSELTANSPQDEPGVVVYENRMSSLYEVGVGPFGSITRDSTYEWVIVSHAFKTS